MTPIYRQADLWAGLWSPGIYVIHGTGTIVSTHDTDHLLMCPLMGPPAMELFPDLDQLAAEAVKQAKENSKVGADYGFVLAVEPEDDQPGIGIFQTSSWYQNDNELFIIGKASSMLYEWCLSNPDVYVRMQFPIHADTLAVEPTSIDPKKVLPLLDILPPTVTIVHGGNI